MKILILLLLVFNGFAVDVSIDDQKVLIFGPSNDDGFGFGVEVSAGFKEWNKLDLRDGYKKTKVQVTDEEAAWIKSSIQKIAREFTMSTEKLSGEGYKSLTIVFGSNGSNWTLTIGWNVKNGIIPTDDVLKFISKVQEITDR